MTQAIVTVEDHWIDGGLGDAVAVQLHTQTPVIRLAITEEPHSGTCKQLLSIHGISREAIYKQIMSLVNNKSVEVSTA
jgi:transketolase